MSTQDTHLQAFRAPYAEADDDLARRFLAAAPDPPDARARITQRATRLVEAVRARTGGLGGIEDFLREYSLSTKEGLALMVLAEALLRVPDSETAERLIEDKLAAADIEHHVTRSDALLVTASAWALGLGARIIHPGETPETILGVLRKRLGLPALHAATRQAMRLLGAHFVLGQTITEALARADRDRSYRYSFDMLGEGARTADDAERYRDAYQQAIEAIGRAATGAGLPDRPGISVKLSALHPRYEPLSREAVLADMVPVVLHLAQRARHYELNFTIDAEEADRLELSLEVMRAVLADGSLSGWDGFGLAVQAYQKRAEKVLDWTATLARALGRRVMVRLVKGAYWDTEIKRAQERGLPDYPVFTRKAMTDLSYLACARKLLTARDVLYPQFATHNALTVATLIEEAQGIEGYEFQRLHGMGEALYASLRAEMPRAACRVYAPVGGHRDLLAYLVRRLLENGANSSFVSRAADPAVPIADVIARPQTRIARAEAARSAAIPLPRHMFLPLRLNSTGVEFGHRASVDALLADIAAHATEEMHAAPLVGGTTADGASRTALSPIDAAVIGRVVDGDRVTADHAMTAAAQGFSAWDSVPVETRARALERAADALESHRGRFLACLQREGGKTLDDAVAELREAADYCRYYAAEARRLFAPQVLPGPTGETNELHHRGRGVCVCISPWNFPLAIFMGQITAALAAGNTVVAKPAGQTPLTAMLAVRLLHDCGVPTSALQFVPGDGAVGAALVADPRTAAVVFTGSTETARAIQRALANRDGAIVPLIAETGGINAMIVDATALPEQVTDDVVASAFRSAGQRCSALRLLCVQEDVADRMIAMIAGATRTLCVGDPRRLATHVGPVIDADAKDMLERWVARMRDAGRVILDGARERTLPRAGTYVAPTMVALDRARDLDTEVFGPVLHLVRWRAGDLDHLLNDIDSRGFALTLGVQTRIEATARRIVARLPNGNVYINRNMIGAVVGSQPFGGTRLSGTGPKAGGPGYLRRLAAEQVVTVNTAAAGGNAALLLESE